MVTHHRTASRYSTGHHSVDEWCIAVARHLNIVQGMRRGPNFSRHVSQLQFWKKKNNQRTCSLTKRPYIPIRIIEKSSCIFLEWAGYQGEGLKHQKKWEWMGVWLIFALLGLVYFGIVALNATSRSWLCEKGLEERGGKRRKQTRVYCCRFWRDESPRRDKSSVVVVCMKITSRGRRRAGGGRLYSHDAFIL